MKIVNYLNVTFNLNRGTYMLYIKRSNEIKYILKDSYHSASAICKITLFIESKLSTLSYNK